MDLGRAAGPAEVRCCSRGGASRLKSAHAAAAASPMPAHESKCRCWTPFTSIMRDDVPSA